MKIRISSLLKSIDLFGDKVQFKVKDKTTFVTLPGALVTLMIYFLIVLYGQQKFRIMWQYEDTQI